MIEAHSKIPIKEFTHQQGFIIGFGFRLKFTQELLPPPTQGYLDCPPVDGLTIIPHILYVCPPFGWF